MIKIINFLNKWIVETGLRPVSTIIIPMLLISCSEKHLINNTQYLEQVEKAFASKKELASSRDSSLFSVFSQNLNTEQSEALKFLYAYMPLSDLADYNGDFFLANVNASLRAREETTWGHSIPDDIFLHYVLPYRINNENLDSFRIRCYDEIMSRVKGKTFADAALEINHWCHEKVSYLPADIRTSAPLSTMLSARGRCGEESTFTVAALRTAGIPARQVYTPRWAHTDDNHAWVEIWIDGKWSYMGACEPEPVLDMGWFTEPARRAMLVHTKSFGAWQGTENVVNINPDFTDVNNLSKYAITKKVFVKVIDNENKPVRDAQVEYQLYNYAEYYPLAVVPTNEKGMSYFETGLGDLLIWAHKNDDFGFRKISVAETDTLELKLNNELTGSGSLDLDLDVPVVRTPLPLPSQTLIDQNAELIKSENNIRQKYIDSWMKPEEAKRLAGILKLDTTKAMNIIARSMGNYSEVSGFLSDTPDSLRQLAVSLLEILPDKDLRDSKKTVFADHLNNSLRWMKVEENTDNKFLVDFILNPRIANEILVPWRHYFLTNLPASLQNAAVADPNIVVRYLDDNIRIADEENYYKTPITPIGVNELKVSDTDSRGICFVAICRSLGIPSRLEPGRNTPQYFFNNSWVDVYFSDQHAPEAKKGYIKLESKDTRPIPEYYIHFTLARFEKGRYNTLEYDFNKKITEFRDELPLPAGKYMLVTSNRINDSKILSNISFFTLSADEHKILNVNIRKDLSEKKILGKADVDKINSLFIQPGTSQACANNKGAVIIWIDPEKEPTKHIFNDLPILKAELDAWGGKFLFLSAVLNEQTNPLQNLRGLPSNTSFGIDNKLFAFKNSLRFISEPDISLPVVVVTDKDGNITFVSSGYRIGIGEQILKAVR